MLEQGHHTEVLCTNATASENEDHIQGLRVRRYGYFYPYWGLSSKARGQLDRKGGNVFSFSLLRALKRLPKMDLLHLHVGTRLGGIGRCVARKRGIPYIITLHGGAFDVPKEEVDSWTSPTTGVDRLGEVSWSVGRFSSGVDGCGGDYLCRIR